MTATQLARPNGAVIMEQVIAAGDLEKLSPDQRNTYYREVCASLGLNPLTQPFQYLRLNDRLVLYARKDATDQLRELRGVSIAIVSREAVDGVYVVTARATTADGRTDEAIGAVPLVKELGDWKTAQSGKRYFQGNGELVSLAPEDRANAVMKAETKAKRRVTLSVCGLGFLDESEADSIPGAQRVVVAETGEIVQREPAARPKPLPPRTEAPGYAPAAADDPVLWNAAGEAPPALTEEETVRQTERARLLAFVHAWQEKADGLGVAYDELDEGFASADEISAYGAALKQRVQAKEAKEAPAPAGR